MSAPGARVVALDYGSARCGVAVSDPSGTLATVAVASGVLLAVIWPLSGVLHDVALETAAQGADLYGVSIDQTDSQVAFRESVSVTIPMLSDAVPQGAATRAFGALFEPTGVSNRALVIVGRDLKVLWSWEGEHPGILPGANLIFDGLAGAKA